MNALLCYSRACETYIERRVLIRFTNYFREPILARGARCRKCLDLHALQASRRTKHACVDYVLDAQLWEGRAQLRQLPGSCVRVTTPSLSRSRRHAESCSWAAFRRYHAQETLSVELLGTWHSYHSRQLQGRRELATALGCDKSYMKAHFLVDIAASFSESNGFRAHAELADSHCLSIPTCPKMGKSRVSHLF